MGAPPSHYCAWCDEAGLLTSVQLDARTKTEKLFGLAIGAPQAAAADALGVPTRHGKNWAIFVHEGINVRLGYDANGAVMSFTLSRANP
jgi:hypothetical protein